MPSWQSVNAKVRFLALVVWNLTARGIIANPDNCSLRIIYPAFYRVLIVRLYSVHQGVGRAWCQGDGLSQIRKGIPGKMQDARWRRKAIRTHTNKFLGTNQILRLSLILLCDFVFLFYFHGCSVCSVITLAPPMMPPRRLCSRPWSHSYTANPWRKFARTWRARIVKFANCALVWRGLILLSQIRIILVCNFDFCSRNFIFFFFLVIPIITSLTCFGLVLTEQKIDIHAVDVSKLKIADLKKIIRDHNLNCADCMEKSDFLRVINKFKETNPPKAAAGKKEL
jgi:hypothetical protein